MIHNILGNCKDLLTKIINMLKGSAKAYEVVGFGGKLFIAKEINVSRNTIRKWLYELKIGIKIEYLLNERGGKKIEAKLHYLSNDIKDVVNSQSHKDTMFKTTCIFTRITVKEVRKQLIRQRTRKIKICL